MFQFQCPRCAGILQADPSQAGQTSQCPICQTPFLIPAPAAPAAPTAPSWPPPNPAQPSRPTTPASVDRPPSWPVVTGPSRQSAVPSFSVTPVPKQRTRVELREPELLHVPCPQCKQLLETPVEMLDQEVRCPYCQAQFQLRRRDSVEDKRRRQQQAELRDRKAGRSWLNYAIAAVVFVVLFLLFLIFSSARASADEVGAMPLNHMVTRLPENDFCRLPDTLVAPSHRRRRGCGDSGQIARTQNAGAYGWALTSAPARAVADERPSTAAAHPLMLRCRCSAINASSSCFRRGRISS
jgi:DNA-directed RNA polymerase subunit RPC12/RpoP